MVISKKKEIPKCHLLVNGQAIRQVKQLSYLGSIFTSDGRCDTEIKRRIGVAKKASKDLANILTNRKVKLDTRKRILTSYKWSVLLYGCKVWTISKNIEEKLKSLELWVFQAYAKSIPLSSPSIFLIKYSSALDVIYPPSGGRSKLIPVLLFLS